MLHCIRTTPPDIWRVERCVCFWHFWLSGPTSSSTVVTFSSIRARFGLPPSCLRSVLPVSRIFFVKFPIVAFCSLSSKNLVNVLRKPFSLNWCKFLITALSSLLHGMLHYIVVALKIIIYNNIVCFCLQTP